MIAMLLIQVVSNLPSDVSALERSISTVESSLPALDKSAATLASSSASAEPWSWLFTLLVVIGVAMEFWVIWNEHREDMETWALTCFGINRSLRPSAKRVFVEYVSVALVAGGIIGELSIGIYIATINSQLRNVDAELRSKNEILRSDSDQLVALVNQEASAANERAAKDEKDLAELQQASLPRNIDVRKLAAGITRFHGTKVTLTTLSDFEPARTTILIQGALVSAKWKIQNFTQMSGLGPGDIMISPGIWVEAVPIPKSELVPNRGWVSHSDEERAESLADLTSAAKALVSALNKQGIDAAMRAPDQPYIGDARFGAIGIFVCLRPIPGMPKDVRVYAGPQQ